MEKLQLRYDEFAYHFNKYGNRMFQEASVFLNDKEIPKYKVIINFYLDNANSLKDYITFDNYNFNPQYKNQGIGKKVLEMLIDFYKEKGFNRFALIISNNNSKSGNIPKIMAEKFDFNFDSTINSLDGDFTLNVYKKLFDKKYVLKNNTLSEKEKYFRNFAGTVITDKIKLKDDIQLKDC